MAGVTVRQRTKKLKDGTVIPCGWEYRFSVASVGGKPKRFEKGGFKKKSDAQKAGNAAYAEYLNTGLAFTPSEMSVSDFMDMWLKEHCEINLKATTVRGYRKIINSHISPAIGHYRISSLNAVVLQQFLNNKFNDGYSRNTLAVMKGILTGSLNYAVTTAQLIKVNPAAGIRLPMKRAESKVQTRYHDRVVVPEEDMRKVLARFPFGHPYHIPLQLGYRCGLRLGEVFGLSWDDIDMEHGVLTVRRQVQFDDGTKQWRLVPPKYDSIRSMRLDAVMLDILAKTRSEQMKNESEYSDLYKHLRLDKDNYITEGDGAPFHAVNIREDGSYINPDAMKHAFRVIHGKDNTKTKHHVYEPLSFDFDFHSLRHTHATMLLSAGVSPVAVKERLGHKNIETTLGIYAHVTESMEDMVLDVMNQIK